MAHYKQGKFKPEYPEKYSGDASNIIYRSGWELSVMKWLDKNQNVEAWSSEEIFIYYRHPLSNTMRRYFPDFLVKFKEPAKIVLFEVKPAAQAGLVKKKKLKRQSKKRLQEEMTIAVNKAKFAAAKELCEKKGWEFQIITEYDLN